MAPGHRLADARSLALHARVAERVRQDPTLADPGTLARRMDDLELGPEARAVLRARIAALGSSP